MSKPHLRMCEIDLPGPPADAESFATLATQMVVEDVATGKVSYLMLVTFVGAKARVWQLHDPPPEHTDDIVRAIAGRERAEALAVVYPMSVPREVDADRAYNVAAEAPDGRFDCLIGLKGGAGLGGDMFRIYGRCFEPPPAPRWFGVAPEGEIDLWMEGPVGAVIDGGEA